MVWGTYALAGFEDVPWYLAKHTLENPPTTPTINKWIASATGTFSGTDDADPDAPISNVYDRWLHRVSRPKSDGTAWSLLLRLSPNAGDLVCIGGHNLSGKTLKVETADDDDFTVRLQTIHNFSTVANNKRLFVALADGYNVVERLRLSITGTSFRPEIGEVLFGARVSMPRDPDLPWDEKGLDNDFTRHTSKSRTIVEYVRWKGGRSAPVRYTTGKSAEETTLRTFLKDTRGKKFLWIEKPQSAPVPYWMVRSGNEHGELRDGPNDRSWEFLLDECQPFVENE